MHSSKMAPAIEPARHWIKWRMDRFVHTVGKFRSPSTGGGARAVIRRRGELEAAATTIAAARAKSLAVTRASGFS